MRKQINHVKNFHEAFGIENKESPTANVSESTFNLRFKLMQEENLEYLEACQNGDLNEIADALGDMMYILCGTILAHGVQSKIELIFEEIQKSNMSKLDKNGKPIYRKDGKILKSSNYFRPNISKILSS
tara:strand:+ start:53 stop:439 length:387 start_codon:yes stop_codon:yes gene_type:complete